MKNLFLIVLLIATISVQSQERVHRSKQEAVPVYIKVTAENGLTLDRINQPVYRKKFIEFLRRKGKMKYKIVKNPDDAKILA